MMQRLRPLLLMCRVIPAFQFDFINAFNYSDDYLKQAMTNWQNSSWDVYIQTNPGTNMKPAGEEY